MESEIRIPLIDLLITILLACAIALLVGTVIGAGAVDTKAHYIEGQRSVAGCEVKNDSN